MWLHMERLCQQKHWNKILKSSSLIALSNNPFLYQNLNRISLIVPSLQNELLRDFPVSGKKSTNQRLYHLSLYQTLSLSLIKISIQSKFCCKGTTGRQQDFHQEVGISKFKLLLILGDEMTVMGKGEWENESTLSIRVRRGDIVHLHCTW